MSNSDNPNSKQQSNRNVTVIIPVLNGRKTLGRALNSLERQYLLPDEVIIIDNGSTDGTVEYAKTWHGNLKLSVVTCSRPGSGAARNVGIKAANSPLLAFLDADDEWYPEKLSEQLADLTNSETFFSGTYMHYRTPSGKILGDNARYTTSDEAWTALSTATAMPVPLSSVVLSKSIANRVGGFNENFRRAQDFEWLVRIAQIAELKIPSQKPLLGYVLATGTSTDSAYVEQGLAAREVRSALREGRPVNYETGVIQALADKKIPRPLVAGQHYRRAGILVGQNEFPRAIFHMGMSVLIDPFGSLKKLQWQVMSRISTKRRSVLGEKSGNLTIGE